MYTDNFEEEILFTPARKDGEACNHLKIVTACLLYTSYLALMPKGLLELKILNLYATSEGI